MEEHQGDGEYDVRTPAQERKASRHIPKAVRRFHELRSGGYCTVGGCNRKMVVLHHLDRFVLNPIPDPERLVPLCDVHHQQVHAGVVVNEDDPAELWRFCLRNEVKTDRDAARAKVDGQVRAYRGSSRMERTNRKGQGSKGHNGQRKGNGARDR